MRSKGTSWGRGDVIDKQQNDKKMKAVKRFTLFSLMDLAYSQAAASRHRKSYVAEQPGTTTTHSVRQAQVTRALQYS